MYLRQRRYDAVCVWWRQWPLCPWRNEIFGCRLTKSMEKKRNGMVLWPPRSPDLTPADFNLCSHLKDAVRRRRVKIRVELWSSDWSGCENTDYAWTFSASRTQSCIPTNGKHFKKKIPEHFGDIKTVLWRNLLHVIHTRAPTISYVSSFTS